MRAALAAADLATLGAAWRSIGLRAAVVEWDLAWPARLEGSLASRLRSALGPALAEAGVRSPVLESIPGDSRPPAAWFLGWDCPRRPVRRLGAELRCVGAVEADWPELAEALARLRLPPAVRPGPLAAARGCAITWPGSPVTPATAFGPPLADRPELDLEGGACLVEAVTPLHLRSAGRVVEGPPPFDVLVRSAGERLRQLCLHWGSGAEDLPPVIARAVREAREARPAWARAGWAGDVPRRSSRTGQIQWLGGVRGAFAYEGVTPLAMAVLAVGAELGVGKGTAFGCGQVRAYRAAPAAAPS